MTSDRLERSPRWGEMAAEIKRDFEAGIPFPEIHMMNVAIKQGTLEPYRKHRSRMDETIWRGDDAPKTIIELGAGYGAMANVWPAGSVVFNVDLPEMLAIQHAYLLSLGATHPDDGPELLMPDGTVITLVAFTDVDRLNVDGAYFFSVWALTETTFETWDYYIAKAARLAGIYAIGWRGWVDIPNQLWPWERLRDAFKTVLSDLTPYLDYDGAPTDSLELAAVNR